jgi:hypothetical protein
MNLKKISLAAAAGFTLLAAAPAFADPQHWAPAHGWRQHHQPRHYYRAPAYVYVPAAPVYYAPPAPVYYYPPPRPAIYGTVPIGDTRVRIGLQF